MTRDIERRDFLALCGLGVLGAQTVMDGASEPAGDSEPGVDSTPVGTDGDSLWNPFGRPDNPRQGDIYVNASGHWEGYVNGAWRIIATPV